MENIQALYYILTEYKSLSDNSSKRFS